jgi:hypothetical protein
MALTEEQKKELEAAGMTMVDELDDELGDWDDFFRAEYDVDEDEEDGVVGEEWDDEYL